MAANQFDYFYAAVGFAAFLVAGLVATSLLEVGFAWPKVARLALIIGAASAGGYVFGRLGVRLLFAVLGIVAAVIAIAIAGMVWHFA
jgi:hypothetical protein